MTQVKPFVIANAGTTKYLCLQNVRLGYGIPAYYLTATKAWNGTQQHRDRNFPAGCDVPVFYSWTGTVDGVRDNYGHIAVRLADGRVWSDGKYFANVDALVGSYLSNGSYLGWGESVNNVTVVKPSGGDMPIPDHDNYYGRYNKLMMQVRGREMSRDEFRKNIVGVSDLTAVERISDNPESDRATDYQQWALANRASIEKQIADLTSRVNQLSGQITGLTQTINEKQAEISTLQDEVVKVQAENKELKAQLATCGGDDTELLNSFGQILRALIARLGIKK
jgi:hypothetical protein